MIRTIPEGVEELLDLLARSKAVWVVPELRTLTEEANSPTHAYNLVLEKTGKHRKALAARWYAIALGPRLENGAQTVWRDIVGSSVRFMTALPDRREGLRKLLSRPI